ncbi:MAG: hypothetical protein IKG42_04740 [Clostridia bacterium]|nr:hypothetical protein [Clostridia bacterium]
MSKFEEQYQKIIKTLENNIKDEEKLGLAKYQLDKMIQSIVDDFSDVLDRYDEKIEFIEKNNIKNNERLRELEEKLESFEKMIELEDYDIFVTCPYCGFEFQTEYDETITEIPCPSCQELIEIDWDEEE